MFSQSSSDDTIQLILENFLYIFHLKTCRISFCGRQLSKRVFDIFGRGNCHLWQNEMNICKHAMHEQLNHFGEDGKSNYNAIVVLKPYETVAHHEIQDFCRQHLAGYKIPRNVVFVNALPRNTSGKVLKYNLRERLNQEDNN
jgi:hypothetical protein